MVGQIMSYISLLDLNSTDELINRINNMINDLPNTQDKSNLLFSYTTKLNEISQLRKYQEKKNEIEKINLDEQEIAQQAAIQKELIEQESNENEINQKIQDYLMKKVKKTDNNKAEQILVAPAILIKLGKLKVKLISANAYIGNKLKKELFDRGMPIIPILEETKKIVDEFFPDGIYQGSNNVRWVFEKGVFYKIDSLNRILSQHHFKIDNTILSLTKEDGSIQLLKVITKNNKDYKIYSDDELIDKIIYLGKGTI